RYRLFKLSFRSLSDKPLPLNYRKFTLVLIAISSIIKLVFASAVELNNDEVYYWGYATHLQWNYFDHPPMVAVFIRFFTANLTLNNEAFIRLPAIFSSAICT